MAALAEELLEVGDVVVPPHLAREDLADVAVSGERLQPLGVANPLGRLLAHEEVAAAAHDRQEVVVVGVVRGQRLDPEDELVVGQRQPAGVAGQRGRRRSAVAASRPSLMRPPLS